MSKKKKVPINSLVSPQKAAEFLAKGKYKEATDAYKKLLKTEQKQEWQDGLATAYLLRAKSLAEKGMFKEAVVLWENRANLCDDKELFEQYIHWLIVAGYHSRAINLLDNSSADLSKTALQQLMVQFGILFFEGNAEVINAISQDAPLVKHYAIIEQALIAYYQDDRQICEEYLNQIPFRSPYRDFCLLLKALLVIDYNQNSANDFLLKIPATSPYASFAKLILLSIEPYSIELLEKLASLNQLEQDFINCIKGWDKQQFKAIIAVKKAINNATDKNILEILINNQQAFGTEYAQHSCMAILPSYKDGIKLYERTFAVLSEFDKNRIMALHYEQQERLFVAKKYWHICVEILKQNRKPNSLKIALILRHQVEILKKHGEFLSKEYVPEFLVESLDFDPTDKECYLNLIDWYKQNHEEKDYYNWAEVAVKKLPKNSEILFVAMKAATARKSFKKALKYAITLLKVDPINVKARNIARASHIAHAHKLLKTGKYPLARKELEKAAQFEQATKQTGIIQINQGLLELQEQGFIKPIKGRLSAKLRTQALKSISSKQLKDIIQQHPQAIELLRTGLKLAGEGILGQFQLIVTCKKQNLDTTKIYPLVVESKSFSNKSVQYEVLELVNLINAYVEDGIDFLYDAVEQMKEQLQTIVKNKLAKDDLLSLCQCMKRLEHHKLLEKFATHGLKSWKQQPALIFYQIYGIVKGDVWCLSDNQLDKLHAAADEAEEQGDKRTAIMIATFVERMYGGDIFPDNPFENLPDEVVEEMEIIVANMEETQGKIDPKKMKEIINKLEKLGIEIPDEIPHK